MRIAQAPYNQNVELTEASVNASAMGGSRKRKGKCKKH